MSQIRHSSLLALVMLLVGAFAGVACAGDAGNSSTTEGPDDIRAAESRPTPAPDPDVDPSGLASEDTTGAAIDKTPQPAAQPPQVVTPAITATPTPASTPAPTAAQPQPTPPSDGPEAGSIQDPANGAVEHRLQEFIVPRDQYYVSRPFEELVKPHFFARTASGDSLEVQGAPDLILEREGKVKIRLRQGDQEGYLDPLALESEHLGEHPVHKIFRLRAMGVPLAAGLERKLELANFAEELFHNVNFEFLWGKETRGVIAEIFPDGTFLVIPFAVPQEWQSDKSANGPNVLEVLPGTRIRYTPVDAETFRVELAPGQSMDPVPGPELSLNDGGGAPPDDGYSRVALEAGFPFLGLTYDTIFVGSDGHITLGSGDGSSSARDATRHTGGPPRLSALLTDLNPDCVGSVHADVRSDRVVVTWDQVVHLQRGAADGCGPEVPANTVRAVLYSDGTIDFIYGELDRELFSQAGGNREAVIGIAKGNGEGPLVQADMTGGLPLEQQAWAIFEEYGPGLPETSKKALASPTHFHVDPRALSARDSSLAREYEEEILSLPFEEQRYPAAPLAKKQCGVYQESAQNQGYRQILSVVGYQFTPAHAFGDPNEAAMPYGEKLSSVLQGGAGEGVRYFGFSRFWAAERLASLQSPWIEECDAAGGVRRYRIKDRHNDDYYLIVRRSLEPDKEQRYKIVKLNEEGSAREIYTAPGIMLMAMPLPWDDNYWMVSSEGWPAPEEGKPADLRWQSVYVVNVENPNEYYEVQYPISQYPNAPEEGLYGAAAALSSDSRFLFNTLYGFTDEGGGLWVADLGDEEFYSKPDNFARIVEWDHMLSWMYLGDRTDSPEPSMSLFVTGKEVADDFAMTANLLCIRNTGLDAATEHKERILRMVGWNPVPFARQTVSEHQFRVAVETHFNYESSLLPRAKGVYIIPVDTSQCE